MRKVSAGAACLLLSCNVVCAQSAIPERQVRGNTLLSERDPGVRIALPEQARHAGAHRWTLYDVADCEVHVFVEADELKNVQRLYWIQFEGYIPSNPDLHYDYSRSGTTKFAGRDFFVDADFAEGNRKARPGSDLEHVQRLIHTNGYTLPDHMINVRLVNLFEQNRKELMIIYAEDMKPTGLTPAELQVEGNAEKQWPAIERKLIENAKASIAIEWTDGP
jgi:hypothetical protein